MDKILRYPYRGTMYIYNSGKWQSEKPFSGVKDVTDLDIINALNMLYPKAVLNTLVSKNPYTKNSDGTFSKSGTSQKYNIIFKDGKYRAIPISYTLPKIQEDSLDNEVSESPQKHLNPKKKSPTKYEGLFSGNARSFDFRKNWVNTHKDYLNSNGSNIDWSNYRGTAQQNLALKKLMDSYSESNKSTPTTVKQKDENPKLTVVLDLTPPLAKVNETIAVTPVVLESDAPTNPEAYYKMNPFSEEAKKRYQEYMNNRQL